MAYGGGYTNPVPATPPPAAGGGHASTPASAPPAKKPEGKRFCNDREAVNFWNSIAKSQPKKTELDVSVFSDGLAHHFMKSDGYPAGVIHNIVEHFICMHTSILPCPALIIITSSRIMLCCVVLYCCGEQYMTVHKQ